MIQFHHLNATLFTARKENFLILANSIIEKMSTWFSERFDAFIM